MRFAVISDIHGNLAALDAVLADIDALDPAVDVTVSAGDVVGHSAHPNEVIAALKAHDINSVSGNYDEAVVGARPDAGADYATVESMRADNAAVVWTRERLTESSAEFLRSRPRELRLMLSPTGRTAVKAEKHDEAVKEFRRGFLLGGFLSGEQQKRVRRFQPKRVLIVHGSPRDACETVLPDTGRSILETIAREANADIIISGHSQFAFHRVVGNVAFIGVGSVGRSRVGRGVAEYAVVEVVRDEIDLEFRSVNYDPEAEARAIEASGLPLEFAAGLRFGKAS